ncbi:replication-associated recombination protein A [Candidatus Parcubacteria bacterium]|nr:replication-associated recombination protein A [Patescibacteria group bacterium]MBU4309768.1 replication-associated recombination protein A [Patescibacteria group bacterium]MBU4431774.1 replication-associated recombination protein A [Patescibacteria group bacterium]MBU4578107.1 replication-associated recombination protein A [Patescibacteria group bacterium]MCG2696644.1 replication-associated recombination protein A [Candidatus Parcubacteria bacterium]
MTDKLNKKPLADRMRPLTLDNFFGQAKVIGEGTILRQAIMADKLPSLVFWGPPGTGKTTLAFIVAKQTNSEFLRLSAVTSGMKELREVVREAKSNEIEGKKTILFVDEIHRWNKSQQDALLPHIENGLIILIGATTENPSFEIRNALLSRCRVFVLETLHKDEILKIIDKAIGDKENGLGELKIEIEPEAREALAQMSNGDARTALNILEFASSISEKISLVTIKQAFQKTHLLYDKNGEEHYNIISALHKSMRGSDENAALYWLARMLEAGEEPLYLARRLVRFASEDIGLANSRALEQAVATYNACHFMGMPECNVVLAQAVVYMSKCAKSNSLYTGYKKAADDVRNHGALPVPMHIRNAPTKLMQELGYGKDYKYSPDHNYSEKQEYLPDELRGRKYL